LSRRDRPQRRFEINVGPLGVAQLAGPNEHMRCELQGQLADWMSVIAVDRTEQFADAVRLENSAVMGDRRVREGTPQVTRRVRREAGGRDGITEDATSELERSAS